MVFPTSNTRGDDLRVADDRGERRKHLLEGGRENSWTEQTGSHQGARVSKIKSDKLLRKWS